MDCSSLVSGCPQLSSLSRPWLPGARPCAGGVRANLSAICQRPFSGLASGRLADRLLSLLSLYLSSSFSPRRLDIFLPADLSMLWDQTPNPLAWLESDRQQSPLVCSPSLGRCRAWPPSLMPCAV